eukprot:scaffold106696_cov17-Tisochrysis_lutea.AAC.1
MQARVSLREANLLCGHMKSGQVNSSFCWGCMGGKNETRLSHAQEFLMRRSGRQHPFNLCLSII